MDEILKGVKGRLVRRRCYDKKLISTTYVLKVKEEVYTFTTPHLIYLTNPHWARVVGYGPFSLWVIHKEDLCPSSGEINRLMIMILFLYD
jgi:hypothetical protein